MTQQAKTTICTVIIYQFLLPLMESELCRNLFSSEIASLRQRADVVQIQFAFRAPAPRSLGDLRAELLVQAVSFAFELLWCVGFCQLFHGGTRLVEGFPKLLF